MNVFLLGYVRVNVAAMGVRRGRWITWSWNWVTGCGPPSGSLEEQRVLLTSEPSLQSPLQRFQRNMLMCLGVCMHLHMHMAAKRQLLKVL